MILAAQRAFQVRRSKWLKEMSKLRATTVLVECIPEGINTKKGLQAYFDDYVFGRRVVKAVHVVKDVSELAPLAREVEWLGQQLALVKSGDHINAVVQRRLDVQRRLELLGQQVDESEEYNSSSAFVTFHARREATVALKLLSPEDEEELEVFPAPDPSDIIWEDLVLDRTVGTLEEVIGYLLLAGLFFSFMPIVIGISSITNIEKLQAVFPFLQDFVTAHPDFITTWNGLMGSLGLTIVMSFLPTFLMLIFMRCFVLKANAYAQLRLQRWYFQFLLVFVLLVTAVGSSLLETSAELIRHPMSVFDLLAVSMPQSSHFYMNYFTVQWTTHAMNATRYVNLLKYLAFGRFYIQAQAKEKSEPEDQDYFGMGSRSARFTLLFVVALVFSTLSPLLAILGIVNFALCRMIYSYLFCFAETRKPDSGGYFWCTQLKHSQQGLFIYVALMTGVLLQKAYSVIPGIIAGSSFALLLYYYEQFKLLRWEHLEFADVKEYDSLPGMLRDSTRISYKQPELPPPTEPEERAPPPPDAIRQAMGALQARLSAAVERPGPKGGRLAP